LTFALASATFTVSVLVVWPILAEKGLAPELWNVPATWVPVLAASLSTALIGVIGRVVGDVLPSRTAAVSATVGVLFALPLIVGFASLAGGGQPWISHVTSLLPLPAAKNVVFADEPGTGQLPSPVALLVLGTWAAAAVGGAWAHMRRRAGSPAVERLQATGV
jgi:hypothetical protein